MNITFQLEGGPWDGQTISTNSDNEVTADFARVLYFSSQGARVGAELSLVSPAASDQLEAVGREGDETPKTRPHAYRIRDRREARGRVTVRAAHAGQSGD